MRVLEPTPPFLHGLRLERQGHHSLLFLKKGLESVRDACWTLGGVLREHDSLSISSCTC